jgi:hypothetical protein
MVTVTPPTATDFKITANNCTAAIPANTMNGCQVEVTFTPSTTTPEMATLNIAATPGGTTVPLTGTGTTPSILLSPMTQSFTALPGQTQSFSFDIKNGGNGPTGMISLSGLPSGGFSVTSDPCSGSTIGAGGKCTLTVQYAPPGSETLGMTDHATLSVSDAYSASDTASAMLTGTAESSGVYLVMTSSPTPATYQGSMSVMFTVTNWGATQSGTLGAVTYTATQASTGDLNGDFMVGAGCMGAVLMSGQSCSYTLTFTAPPAPDAGDEGGSSEGGVMGAPFTGTTGVSDGTNSPTAPFSGCTQAGACM